MRLKSSGLAELDPFSFFERHSGARRHSKRASKGSTLFIFIWAKWIEWRRNGTGTNRTGRTKYKESESWTPNLSMMAFVIVFVLWAPVVDLVSSEPEASVSVPPSCSFFYWCPLESRWRQQKQWLKTRLISGHPPNSFRKGQSKQRQRRLFTIYYYHFERPIDCLEYLSRDRPAGSTHSALWAWRDTVQHYKHLTNSPP